MAKRIIDVEVERAEKYDLMGPLSAIIETLTKYADKHGPDATLYIDDDVWEYGERFTRATISIVRSETDEEEAARESSEAARKAASDAREREQWEKLSAKYGNKET